eukprot:CAMPEP_0194033822 /NCGR_PEP_ID=MMETSP0009_2-20130614/6345_1 /TAXON_ID=210454 /ORGANISM="Grammatophora oceanica, Strain CCMP 410" /LENGTH=611 /DNA_ID=CAMNT_0038674549 /DNA_START=1768 /DNA_END=3600 /DNA_ORIENTATION=-
MTPEMNNDNDNDLSEVFFQAKPCLRTHIQALVRQGEKYQTMLRYMCKSGTIGPCSSAIKARILAALHMCNKHKAVVEFLPFCEIPDVNKALHLLDRPRKIRQLEAKIKTIEEKHPHVVKSEEEETTKKVDADGKVVKKRKKRRKIDGLRQAKQQLVSEVSCSGTTACREAHDSAAVEEMIKARMSVSGALARKIQAWTKAMPQDYLEFVLLGMPLEPWKELADVVHLRPSDFVVPYFLEYVFGKKPEGRNFVTQMKDLLDGLDSTTDETAVLEKYFGVAGEFPTQLALQYALLRRYPILVSKTKVMEDLASRIPLDTVIWWYEEFHGKGHCDDIIKERLGEKPEAVMKHFQKSKVTFGKLIERIMTCRRLGASFAEDLLPLATARLEELKATWADASSSTRMAVFGDASGSMETAIEAATIFASMVSACFDGELSFFDYTVMPSPHLRPSRLEQALEVCTTVKVRGATCNAAALWPYYEQKKVMDTFVMVTDEGENQSVHGKYRFADLFAMYLKDVNPKAKLVIARVGRGDRYFQNTLENHGFDYTVVHLDENRPDHAKFDALLGQLSVVSTGETGGEAREAMEESGGETKSAVEEEPNNVSAPGAADGFV